MKAFYDSLDTLQKVQFATKKDYLYLGFGVFVAIVIFGVFFIGVDTIWSGLYKTFYTTMRGDVALESIYQDQTSLLGDESLVNTDTSLLGDDTATETVQETPAQTETDIQATTSTQE